VRLYRELKRHELAEEGEEEAEREEAEREEEVMVGVAWIVSLVVPRLRRLVVSLVSGY
jgi:hypothetical protein